jgi:Ca2+-binding RTX toxin-like protein
VGNSLAVFSGHADWLGETLFRAPTGASLLTGSVTRHNMFNEVVGTTGADKLYAVEGIDNILFGGGGADKLFANDGKDILHGDESTSGAEADCRDTFVFKSLEVLDKSIKKTDVIADFDELDRIDLSGLTGPKLDFIGKAKFSDDAGGEVRFKAFKEEGYAALQIRVVDPKVWDAVINTQVKILAEAPAMAMGTIYQTLAGSLIL